MGLTFCIAPSFQILELSQKKAEIGLDNIWIAILQLLHHERNKAIVIRPDLI